MSPTSEFKGACGAGKLCFVAYALKDAYCVRHPVHALFQDLVLIRWLIHAAFLYELATGRACRELLLILVRL